MGSNGAASGIDPYKGRGGKPTVYGSEFTTLHIAGDVKFVTMADNLESVRTPMETRSPGRVYATVTKGGDVSAIATYDSNGVKKTQIDLLHKHQKLVPHVHDGRNHADGREPTQAESLLIKYVVNEWSKHQKGGK